MGGELQLFLLYYIWEENFSCFANPVKEFIVDLWEVRTLNLYGDGAHPGPQSRF